ncbi:MAG: Crp/Fnr family transcriptional regulator [Bacteroidota bacterium]
MAFEIEKYRFKTESILDGLPSGEFRLLKDQMTRVEVKKGKVIYKEGFYSKGVYILRKGKVKISQLSKDGDEQIAYIYKKGEIMGYRPLLCNTVHPVTATALDECVLSFIPQQYFLRVLDHSLVLSRRLLTNLAYEFSVWINTMSVLAQQPVKERVALVLLILNEKYKRKGKEHLPAAISLSRQDMASYARTTIETLARMLRYFKDEKIIRTEGWKIIILKPKELEKIAEFY